jgi:hypothetical protein
VLQSEKSVRGHELSGRNRYWIPGRGPACARLLVLEQRRLRAFIGGLEIARHRLASHFEDIGFVRPADGKQPPLRVGIAEFGMVRQQDRRAGIGSQLGGELGELGDMGN